MEKLEKTLEGLCDTFDRTKDIEDKEKLVALMDQVADIHVKVAKQELKEKQAEYDHEEATDKIKATFEIQQSKEIREDREFALQEEKVKSEIVNGRLQISEERKKQITNALLTGLGTAGTIGVGILGVQNTRHVFDNLHEWDRKDVLPVSTGWDIFRKNFKG